MDRHRTWSDAIAENEQRLFVGREHELSAFRVEAERQPPRSLIFFVSGQGGVGKTTLLKRYRETAESLGFITAIVDEQATEVPAVLGRLAEQIGAIIDSKLSTFGERYQTYQSKRAEIEADPEAPHGMAAMLGKGLVRGGLLLADIVPGIRKGVELLDQEALEKAAGDWLGYLSKKVGSRDDVALLRDSVRVLSEAFFRDLNDLAKHRRLLLCLENYERTRAYLDDWIVRLSEFAVSDGIRFAIASRTPPGPDWGQLGPIVHDVRLDVFSPEEAETFLDKAGIGDLDRRQEILSVSGRLPVMMSWLASADGRQADRSVRTSDIVSRFLRWIVEPELRQVALVGAVPARFDLDVLSVILGRGRDDRLVKEFDWLRRRPFVSEDERGWKYHEVVRLYMRRYQRQESPDTYQALNRRMAEVFEKRRSELAVSGRQRWSNRKWRELTLEWISHRVAAEPKGGWVDAIDVFGEALDVRRSFAREVVGRLSSAVVREDLEDAQQRDCTLFAEQLELIDRDDPEQGLKMFDRLCSMPGIGSVAQAAGLVGRARARMAAGDEDAALADLNEAVRLNPVAGRGLIVRAVVLRHKGQYEEALTELERAVAAGPEFAHDAYTEIGLIRAIKGEHREAAGALREALRKGPNCTFCWKAFAENYRKSASRDDTVRELRELAVITGDPARAKVCVGLALAAVGCDEESLRELEEPDLAGSMDVTELVGRSELFLRVGQVERAINDLEAARQRGGGGAKHMVCERLGEALQAARRFDKRKLPF